MTSMGPEQSFAQACIGPGKTYCYIGAPKLTSSQMNKLLFRVVAILLHVIINFILISYLVSFDLTGSWIRFFLFLFLVIILVGLFVKHLLSFLLFVKSNT